MAGELNSKRVAILVTDGFEQVEMTEPRKALEDAGARTDLVSPALPSPDLGDLGRELEDEAYRRWQERRAGSELADEAFSAVIRVAPEDLPDVARAIRAVLAPYQRDDASGTATGAIVRLFPLLPSD